MPSFFFFFLLCLVVTGRQICWRLTARRRGPPVKVSSPVWIPVAAVSKHVEIENTDGGTRDNFKAFSTHSVWTSAGRLMFQAPYPRPFITLSFITFYCVASRKYQHGPSSIGRLQNLATNTLTFLMNCSEMQQTERVCMSTNRIP